MGSSTPRCGKGSEGAIVSPRRRVLGPERGVVTDSSGNHAQAVARAARVLGLRAVVVMPSGASALKRRRTEADGAEVVITTDDSDELVRRSTEIAAERGWVRIPSYDHPLIA